MTFEIVTTPANTPASLLFQQCLVEIVPDNKIMNMAKEEVAGYFLDKIENLEMTNADTSICGVSLSINLIYKDHIMPRKEFLQSLKQLFKNRMRLPSIILGDFNINTLEDSDLMGIAKEHKFESLVHMCPYHF